MSTHTNHHDDGPADPTALTRRSVLRYSALAGAVGLSGAALAACGGDDAGTSTGATTSPSADASSAAPTSEAAPTAPATDAASGPVLTKAADVPVGGAVIADGPDGAKYVVVQASADQFTGLSAICTHQRCTVAVAGEQLNCPCHGSRYSLTGEVLRGPATAPLPTANVALSGEDVVLT
jgi:cytochrome b6-f complex iron-sulfur subunit